MTQAVPVPVPVPVPVRAVDVTHPEGTSAQPFGVAQEGGGGLEHEAVPAKPASDQNTAARTLNATAQSRVTLSLR